MKQNRYYFIYLQIINRARNRALVSPCEKHHVIPRCMGGTDDPFNIVALTLREHFICHKLLIRFTDGDDKRKLQHAFSYMVLTKDSKRPSLRVTSRDYELCRMLNSLSRPKSWGENISKALKGRKVSKESVDLMRKTLTGRKLSDDHRKNISNVVKGRKHSTESKRLISEAKGKVFIVCFPDGHIETINNLKTWCKKHGYNYHSMINNSKLPNSINRGPLKGFNISISS